MPVYRFRQVPLKVQNYWAATTVSSYFAVEVDIDTTEILDNVQPVLLTLGYEYIETDPITEPSVWRKRSDGYFQRMPLLTGAIGATSNPSSNFSAEPGGLYFVNSSAGTITVTPPSLPQQGDTFAIGDSTGSFSTNNVTIDFIGSAQLFLGLSQNFAFDLSGDYKTFLYTGATYGWILS